MLPGASPLSSPSPWSGGGGGGFSPSRGRQFSQYLRRLTKWHQMDVEQTLWQMVYLIVNPAKAYRITAWHKQTKNQWARDDPAFVALMLIFMTCASCGFSVAFRVGFGGVLKTIFWAVFVDFLTVGIVVASLCWRIANTRLLVHGSQMPHSVDQSVEWLYAFDVHCNSFFPTFFLLYVVQYFLLPFLLRESRLATLVSGILYFVAMVYYFHVTFLGYSTLPFLQNTRVFLFPLVFCAVLFVVTQFLNVNLTISVMTFYFGR
jgi:UNC-50 family